MSGYSQDYCIEDGCYELQKFNGTNYLGKDTYKPRCSKHHKEHFAAKKGLTARDWENSFHPYRKHRKDKCDNRDGHVTGTPCTATITWAGQLDVDHIDGDPSNQDPSNLQTLCKNCHAEKTMQNGDAKTPGRETLRSQGIAVYG